MIYFRKNIKQKNKIKIQWSDFTFYISRVAPYEFKLNSVFKGRANKLFNTTNEVLDFLMAKDSYDLLMELDKGGFSDLVRLYHKTSLLVKEVDNTNTQLTDIQTRVDSLKAKLSSQQDQLTIKKEQDKYADWNDFLNKNKNLTDWKEVESKSTQTNNSKLLGSFYCQWVLDDGYIDVYLQHPIKNNKYWYLAIMYPEIDGEEQKKTIQSKDFLGLCSYITHAYLEIDIDQFILSCKEMSTPHKDVVKVTDLWKQF